MKEDQLKSGSNDQRNDGGEEPIDLRHRPLRGFLRAVVIICGIIVVFLGVNTVFDLEFFVGYHLYSFSLYYIVFGLLLACSFLVYPPKRGMRRPWSSVFFGIDIGLFILIIAIFMYFAWYGQDIVVDGWARFAPPEAIAMAVIGWLLLLESIRRIFGPALFSVIGIVSFYPLVAAHMPGLLNGVGNSFLMTATFHMLSLQSAIGLLLRMYVEVILGFVVFGIVVVNTGGAEFFLNLALSLVGRMRGGTAKVAILASAFFGSVNGQPIVNVLTTGSVTIPAMKKAGFRSHVAGAVETCASTAGTFTPPIMGVAAFVMASFLQTSYTYVALAAAVPAFLFYFALYVQIDGYAVKHGLEGLKKEEMPSFWKTLQHGWFYIPGVAVLIYVLFFQRLVGISAFLGSAIIIVLAQIRKSSRFTWPTFLRFLEDSARTLMDLVVVIAGVGMLIGVFSFTGIGVTFAREFLNLAGGNLAYLLVLAAVAGLIMGMGMTLLAVYIFLAIVIAPALTMAGIPAMSANLFCLYVGMLSYITPPIALCAFTAAIIAKTSAMRVGLKAVQLGGAIYLLPFMFVLDPRLVLEGGVAGIVFAVVTTALGIFVIASALEGYMLGLGRLWPGSGPWSIAGYSYYSYVLRAILTGAGILLGLPWLHIKALGFVICAGILLPSIAGRIRKREKGPQPVVA